MLDVKKVVARHHPKLIDIDYESPLSVGNGRFAFTADVTGLQTFATDYEQQGTPLCTMSEWGWHSQLLDGNPSDYQLSDLEMTHYQFNGRDVIYPVDRTESNQDVYDWLRHNPHKFNLIKIGFIWRGKKIQPDEINQIDQTLDIYEGKLISSFNLFGEFIRVITIVGQEEDVLSVEVESNALKTNDLAIEIAFPYGSHHITGSDWDKKDKHVTELTSVDRQTIFKRQLDDMTYHVSLVSEQAIKVKETDIHHYHVSSDQATWRFSLRFSEQEQLPSNNFESYLNENKNYWKQFWQNGGLVDFSESTDRRANELERRVILSLYLLTIQCTGNQPAQETGLTCNSWYGKFHLEMHLWHTGALPLFNHSDLLERSFNWYETILPKAVENAVRNGYKGARWPKMVASEGVDCPSPIAPLLIWQQTHIIYMLELVFQATGNEAVLKRYWLLVEETAKFVVDFLVYDQEDGCYHMVAPIIPAQEEYDPRSVQNPTFELEYWRFSLKIASKWANRIGIDKADWMNVADQIAESMIDEGLYMAHAQALDTFEEFNKDHPSMVGAFGLIPNDRIDKKVMGATLKKAIDVWEYKTLWGWDFAMMAMTAARLDKPQWALDLLLMETDKNYYAVNGHNLQKGRRDLPTYLPGNGSLLFAVALLVKGISRSDKNQQLIELAEGWKVKAQNIHPFPY